MHIHTGNAGQSPHAHTHTHARTHPHFCFLFLSLFPISLISLIAFSFSSSDRRSQDSRVNLFILQAGQQQQSRYGTRQGRR